MSSVSTYDCGEHWPLLKLDNEWKVIRDAWYPTPGDWVTHVDGGRGVIVASTDDQVCVVWSIPPQKHDSSKFVFPVIRNAGRAKLIAQQLIGLQPMSMPAGLVFYRDYEYGNRRSEQPAADPVRPVEPLSGSDGPREALEKILDRTLVATMAHPGNKRT